MVELVGISTQVAGMWPNPQYGWIFTCTALLQILSADSNTPHPFFVWGGVVTEKFLISTIVYNRRLRIAQLLENYTDVNAIYNLYQLRHTYSILL